VPNLLKCFACPFPAPVFGCLLCSCWSLCRSHCVSLRQLFGHMRRFRCVWCLSALSPTFGHWSRLNDFQPLVPSARRRNEKQTREAETQKRKQRKTAENEKTARNEKQRGPKHGGTPKQLATLQRTDPRTNNNKRIHLLSVESHRSQVSQAWFHRTSPSACRHVN
jgi:hypothetical protein